MDTIFDSLERRVMRLVRDKGYKVVSTNSGKDEDVQYAKLIAHENGMLSIREVWAYSAAEVLEERFVNIRLRNVKEYIESL